MDPLNTGNSDIIAQIAFFRRQQELAAHDRQNQVGPSVEAETCQVPEGSLIVVDEFVESNLDAKSHGENVEKAARNQGFKGSVFTMSRDRAARGAQTQELAQLDLNVFSNPGTSPEEMREGIKTHGKTVAVAVLKTETRTVLNATSSGARNSVLNISAGKNLAHLTRELYMRVAKGSSPDKRNPPSKSDKVFAENMARAYDVDLAKLISADAKLAGPERAKLQEGIARDLSDGVAHQDVAKAQAIFATEVRRFESNHNSVVIATGNAGQDRQFFKTEAYGKEASFPSGFEANVLETPEATMVGATNGAGKRAKIADYNSLAEVDIYANGSLQGQGAGTSFAAPRVAAVMAELHKRFPDLDSEQIEGKMQENFADFTNASFILR